jgi:hypothetical protein
MSCKALQVRGALVFRQEGEKPTYMKSKNTPRQLDMLMDMAAPSNPSEVLYDKNQQSGMWHTTESIELAING